MSKNGRPGKEKQQTIHSIFIILIHKTMTSTATSEATAISDMRNTDRLLRLGLVEALAEGYNRANPKLISFALKYIPNEISIEILSASTKFLADTPKEHRMEFISFCLKYILPIEMLLIDGLIFMFASSRSQIAGPDTYGVDPDSIDYKYDDDKGNVIGITVTDLSECTFDDDGRISTLEFSDYDDFDVPAIIGRLHRLNESKLGFGSRSLPFEELSKLPQLETLKLINCSPDLYNNFPIRMELRHLKKFRASGWSVTFESVSAPLLKWIVLNQLPSLESIQFWGYEFGEYDKKTTEIILSFPCTVDNA